MCSFLRERSFLGARHFKKALLLEGDRCRFVVIDVDTGGWFSQEAVEFVDSGKSARLSAKTLRQCVAPFGTLGLATPVDVDHRMWPFVR